MRKQAAESQQPAAGKNTKAFLLQSTSYQRQADRGFTLLLAALIASIVLALGAAIFSIAQKEVTLSSIGRDSQFAFYAADTLAECALYWDFRYGYFGTTTPAGAQNPTCDIDTNGHPVELQASGHSVEYPYLVTSKKIDIFYDSIPVGNFCAQVTVSKSRDPATGSVRTIIHADGYSISCDSINVNPRALQRTVELHY